MGFTPLEGVAMATRSGTVDPGLLLWLIHRGMSPEHLADALEHRSGLAGLSGTSGDLRDVLAARAAGSQPAALSYDVFLHRLVTGVAAMAASAGGLDVLVLTGGIGEHSAQLRVDLAEGLAFLGVAVDRSRNSDVTTDAEVTADGAVVRTLVVTAREDVQIARETTQVLGGERGTLDPADARTDVDLLGPEKEVRR
jgi:acetate kinase